MTFHEMKSPQVCLLDHGPEHLYSSTDHLKPLDKIEYTLQYPVEYRSSTE